MVPPDHWTEEAGERIEVVKKDVNEGIDISIARRSAPVEVLSVGQRTRRALQRAGISTVAEIVLPGKPKLGAARRVGSLTTGRIFEASGAGKKRRPGNQRTAATSVPPTGL